MSHPIRGQCTAIAWCTTDSAAIAIWLGVEVFAVAVCFLQVDHEVRV